MTKLQTRTVSPDEMEGYIARLGSMTPQAAHYEESSGIPREAYEMMAAKELYLMMSPETQGGPMAARPAIPGDKGLSVIIARCPPGDKPLLHAHFKTRESFMCLTGRFRIRWGDAGENETYLDPFDMIAVPRAVCRDFTNVTDQDALLLVLIHGTSDEDFNDIAVAPDESQMILDRFGQDVIDHYRKLGVEFLGVTA